MAIFQQLKKIIHPRYIFYWLLLLFLYPFTFLPKRLQICFGYIFGFIAITVSKSRRKIVKINLKLCFSELNEKELADLYRKFVVSLGLGFIETAIAWFRGEKYLRKISRLEADAKSLEFINNPEQAVVLVGSHSTLLELGVRLLGIYVPSAGMYRPLKNPFFEEWIKFQRARAATELVHFKDMRKVVKILQKGENIWYALDQDMGRKTGVYADFFGRKACSVNILPKLAKIADIQTIPVFIWREKNSYVVKILPAISPEITANSDAIEVMQKVNSVIEKEVRAQPEQYFWVHRRFKNPADGDEYPY